MMTACREPRESSTQKRYLTPFTLDHMDEPDWDAPAVEAKAAPQYKGQDEVPDFSDVLDQTDQPDWDTPVQTDAQNEQDAPVQTDAQHEQDADTVS